MLSHSSAQVAASPSAASTAFIFATSSHSPYRNTVLPKRKICSFVTPARLLMSLSRPATVAWWCISMYLSRQLSLSSAHRAYFGIARAGNQSAALSTAIAVARFSIFLTFAPKVSPPPPLPLFFTLGSVSHRSSARAWRGPAASAAQDRPPPRRDASAQRPSTERLQPP